MGAHIFSQRQQTQKVRLAVVRSQSTSRLVREANIETNSEAFSSATAACDFRDCGINYLFFQFRDLLEMGCVLSCQLYFAQTLASCVIISPTAAIAALSAYGF